MAADGETPEAAPGAGQPDDHDPVGSIEGQPPPRSGEAPRRPQPGPRPDDARREIAARPFPWVVPETRTRPWRRSRSADGPGPGGGSRGGGPAPGRRQPRPPARPEPPALRYELRSLAELAGLTGFAVVQPVLSPFGESPETFVAAGASASNIVVFAVLVAVVPLTGLALGAAATRVFGMSVRRWVQTVLVGILAGLAMVWFVRHQDGSTGIRIAAGLLVGLGVAALHRRFEPGRMFLRYASPTPVLLVASFLFASPVAPLVNPPDARAPVLTATRGDQPDVVVLVLDELPTLSLVDGAGQIDRERFPNFARFADTSTWFRNHSTVAPKTLAAVPALVTSKMPLAGKDEPSADYETYPDTIFQVMAKTHEVHAVEWATDLCPPSVCPEREVELDQSSRKLLESEIGRARPTSELLRQARSLWWDQTNPLAADAGPSIAIAGAKDAEQLVLPGVEFLSGLRAPAGDRPVFDWLDVGLPHEPWRLLPSGNQYNGPEQPLGSKYLSWPPDPIGTQLTLATRAGHLLQLQWADRYLGAVLDRLAEIDRFDDALVVLTADHGISFVPGEPIRDVTPVNGTQTSYPPLFVKAPGQTEGVVDDGNAISLDLLPTVADYVGVEVPWEVDGMSLRDGATRADPYKASVAFDPTRFAVRFLGDIVRMEGDGLAAIKDSPFLADDEDAGLGDDGLNVYRYGRQGHLIGEPVDGLSVCAGGPPLGYEPPKGWGAWADGSFDVDSGQVPFFHSGTIDAPGSRDVVAVVDGVIAGWAVSRPNEDGNPFGMLLAEPLVNEAEGEPTFYEVQTGTACLLRSFSP